MSCPVGNSTMDMNLFGTKCREAAWLSCKTLYAVHSVHLNNTGKPLEVARFAGARDLQQAQTPAASTSKPVADLLFVLSAGKVGNQS